MKELTPKECVKRLEDLSRYIDNLSGWSYETAVFSRETLSYAIKAIKQNERCKPCSDSL